jgi:hypothetical protein
MYHLRFKGKHYNIGYNWGKKLLERNISLIKNIPFQIQNNIEILQQTLLSITKSIFLKF